MKAGDVFDQRDEDGVVILINKNSSAELVNRVREAVSLHLALAVDIEG